jgi:hypothetical protein
VGINILWLSVISTGSLFRDRLLKHKHEPHRRQNTVVKKARLSNPDSLYSREKGLLATCYDVAHGPGVSDGGLTCKPNLQLGYVLRLMMI